MINKCSVILAVLCSILGSSIISASELDGKLDVTIFYETLCPDSVRFISNQLYPNFEALAPFTNFKFVPFGKAANINDGESFECQHGPEECRGNMLQSCVLHLLGKNPMMHMRFVGCQMHPSADHSGKTCTRMVGIDWNLVDRCMKSDVGRLLQLRAERETNAIWPQFIPTIVFNGVFNQDLQDRSQIDFRGAACHFLRSSYPALCANTTATKTT
ncbi:GILT-like protein 1 [Ctenocephalides felis]|uniref:GILT-like protein 1 n=1 Tax=Ctenocephalides felis TaxID=7515 RepID=UPI000E6E4F30|nr:GILT-like protein 1 [Ctenocephalides felis]XP_026468042.1 GILT-like protein 1 [Ctenocephalides felis]